MIAKPSVKSFRLPRMLTSLRTAYDASATTRHNENHWAAALGYDADSALVSELPTIRNRCRHECRNNPYALGISRKMAHYVVGTGPTLEVQLEDETVNAKVEAAWAAWADSCDWANNLTYAQMLHLGVQELFPSGEYIRLFQNAESGQGVRLRMLFVESDRLTAPVGLAGSQYFRDGIKVDQWGRKVEYWIAKYHPQSSVDPHSIGEQDFLKFPPDQVIHFYLMDRPEQTRGTPWLSAVLNTFASMRRWDEATMACAERAALFGIIMVTNSDMLLGDNPSYVDPEEWELPAGMGVIAPPGYDAKQVQPQHPGPQYEVFKRGKLMDAGASTDMPYNVLASDSSGHNYASGRLDWQGLTRAVGVIRSWLEKRDCGPVFAKWYGEARAILPELRGLPASLPIAWRWPGFEHVDPQKEASAAQLRIANKLQTYADWYGKQGLDWREQFAQAAAEEAEAEKLGITLVEAKNGQAKQDDESDGSDAPGDARDARGTGSDSD